MSDTRAVFRYGARIAVLGLVAVVAVGCSRSSAQRDDRMSSGAYHTDRGMSGQGGYAQGGYATTRGYTESDRAGTSGTSSYDRSDTRTSRGDTYEGNEERRSSSTSTSHHHSLSERVKRALSRNDRTRSLDVDVEAHKGGVVTLTGNVHRDTQKRQAGEVARQVKGVKRVRNDIQVGHTSSASERR